MKKLLVIIFLVMLFHCFIFSQIPFGIERLKAEDAAALETLGPDAIDSRLLRLIAVYEQQGEEAALAYASRFSIPYSPEKGVRVELIAPDFTRHLPFNALRKREADLRMTLLSNHLRAMGGHVLHRYGLNLSGRIPLDKVKSLAAYASTIHLPFPLRPHVTSEGVGTIEAYKLQQLTPFQAGPVHVCVMDIGFQNYQQLVGTELPADFSVHTVRFDGESIDGVHGTACAEIVHDVAPDAKITGLATYYVSDIFPATDWILDNDVDVVSASIGHYYSPGDGTGYENEMAKLMKENGIVYVTSAGNEGRDHWSGTFNDPDGNGWHNFSGDDEILSFSVPAYAVVRNILRWNDWGDWNPSTLQWSGSTQDYDLYLYYQNPSTGVWQRVDDASSFNRQPGYRFPIEDAGGYYSPVTANWGLGIRRHNADRDVYFNLFVLTNTSMEYSNASNSIGIPADSPNIVAVGASDALTDQLHSYSSQGPTLDGRIKPDVTAPSGVSTSPQSYGMRGFYGTSASCPHMAGLIALFKSRTPYNADQILASIYARVLDLGIPGFDNLFGRGRIRVGGQ